jgi:hypothetical protein
MAFIPETPISFAGVSQALMGLWQCTNEDCTAPLKSDLGTVCTIVLYVQLPGGISPLLAYITVSILGRSGTVCHCGLLFPW